MLVLLYVAQHGLLCFELAHDFYHERRNEQGQRNRRNEVQKYFYEAAHYLAYLATISKSLYGIFLPLISR